MWDNYSLLNPKLKKMEKMVSRVGKYNSGRGFSLANRR